MVIGGNLAAESTSSLHLEGTDRALVETSLDIPVGVQMRTFRMKSVVFPPTPARDAGKGSEDSPFSYGFPRRVLSATLQYRALQNSLSECNISNSKPRPLDAQSFKTTSVM